MKNEWVDIAIRAAEQAGEEILKIYNSDYEVITKADESPVTAADIASNNIIQSINYKNDRYYASVIFLCWEQSYYYS